MASCKSRRGRRKSGRDDSYKFYNLIIRRSKWPNRRSYTNYSRLFVFIKSKTETLRSPVLFTKTNGSFDRPSSVLSLFFKQAILSRRCLLSPAPSPPPLSSVAVRSSLVIFNYRIFNRELLRLSRHGCLLFRESFARDRRVVRRQFIYINSE